MKSAIKTVLSSSIICFFIFSYHQLLEHAKEHLHPLITVETIVLLSIIGIVTNLDIE